MTLTAGKIIDRYIVESVLGEGGMATVYQVRHQTLGSLHALKVLHVEGRGITERLLAEGRVQAGLDHPNALVVTDVVEVEGLPGLVMEYVDGGTIDEWVEAESPPREARLAAFRDVCDAVATAHERGWIHRDLKPANVLIKRLGERVIPKVADFGLVKAVVGEQPHDGPRTRRGMPMGTPGYMAPEQIESAAGVDARADVYSLGCILVWLLTGHEAFDGGSVLDVFAQVAAGEHTGLPPEDPLHHVAERALATSAEARYADARSLLDALESPEREPLAEDPSPSSAAVSRTGLLPALGVGLGAVLVLGALTGVGVLGAAFWTVSSRMSGGTDCELGGEERVGWIRGVLPSLTSIPDPYELDEATEVVKKIGDEEIVCTLPAGTLLDVRSRSRRPFSEAFWLSVEGDAVTLP